MSPRTIVVGAGVIGLSIAERIAAAGDRVTLVDRGAPGRGTSATSFAWLNANGKVPWSYHRLNVEGVDAWRRLGAEIGTARWLHLNGRIQWAERESEIAQLDRSVEAMRAWDYPVEAITADAARALDPDLRIGARAEVRWWPTEGFVVPSPAIEWLLARVRSRGIEVSTGAAVAGLIVHGGAVRGVELESGRVLEADRVVSCVGRWTEAFLAGAGVHVPMQPIDRGSPSVGLLGYTTPAATRLARTITGPGLNVRPDTTRRYVLQGIGLDDLADPATEPDPAGEVAGELLARARTLVAGFEGVRLDELRVGHRAVPLDRITVAGWAPGVTGLYVVTTHSGYTLALRLGELVGREVAEERDEPALVDFRPARFKAPVEAAAISSRPVH